MVLATGAKTLKSGASVLALLFLFSFYPHQSLGANETSKNTDIEDVIATHRFLSVSEIYSYDKVIWLCVQTKSRQYAFWNPTTDTLSNFYDKECTPPSSFHVLHTLVDTRLLEGQQTGSWSNGSASGTSSSTGDTIDASGTNNTLASNGFTYALSDDALATLRGTGNTVTAGNGVNLTVDSSSSSNTVTVNGNTSVVTDDGSGNTLSSTGISNTLYAPMPIRSMSPATAQTDRWAVTKSS
jgi:hypothetical protein